MILTIKFYFYYWYWSAYCYLSSSYDWIFNSHVRKISFFVFLIWIIGFIIELKSVQNKIEITFDDYQVKNIPVKLTKRLLMKAICWPVFFAWVVFWCMIDMLMGIIDPVLYISTPLMWQTSKFKAFITKRIIG